MTYYERLLKKFMPHLDCLQRRQEAESKLGDWARSPRNTETVSQLQALHTEQITEQIGVLCLSAVRDNILMWSHYADSHGGICLEFDGCFEFFAQTHEVMYPPVRPRINPFRQSQDEMMEAALLTKAEYWRYEQEWRLVQNMHGPGVYHFPPEAFTGVILGAQISPTDVKKVLGWIEKRDDPVKLYRTSPCDKSFSLNIEEASVASLRTE